MQEAILRNIRQDIIRAGISSWSSVDPENIKLEKITGGLTNILYKATSGDNVLLVRIFGKSDGLLNRVSENEIYKQLSSGGISPRLLGVFNWGRLEEYLTDNFPLRSGMDMISITSERDCVSLIAKALSRLHSATISLDPCMCSADIFDVLGKWFELANKYRDSVKSSPRCPDFKPPSISQLRDEILDVTSSIKGSLLCSLIVQQSISCKRLLSRVLCHNDLLSGNIMLDPKTDSVRLIDFEYSGLNYAVADIANVFTAVCESIMLSGDPQDVKRNFPSRDIQLHFLECYLGHPVDRKEEEVVLLVVLAFAMIDELRWTLWGIIQANQSTVDFDYVFYYNSRFDAFKCYKSLFTERMSKLL
jgi:choline/ethanolamine kinase